MRILATVKAISELKIKQKAARELLGNKFAIYATGDFMTKRGDIIFLRQPAEVINIDRIYVTIQLEGEAVKAYPCNTDNPTWPSEFLIAWGV